MNADSTSARVQAAPPGRRFVRLDAAWADWVGLAARLILGGALFIAGAVKVGHLDRNVLSVRAYKIVSYDLAQWIGYAQPFVELLVGLMLILGVFTRFFAVLGSLAMLIFIGGIASVWARGLSLDCGCFSAGGSVAAGQTHYLRDILRDTGFLLCGAWLIGRPRSQWAVDRWLLAPVPLPDEEPASDQESSR